MKIYWSGGIAPLILGLGEWSASFLGDRAPGTHWIGRWVGPKVGLDAVEKRKIPNPRQEWNPLTPIVQPVASSYPD
jgi:hypothetical protein